MTMSVLRPPLRTAACGYYLLDPLRTFITFDLVPSFVHLCVEEVDATAYER
jgi:hypothetical protein